MPTRLCYSLLLTVRKWDIFIGWPCQWAPNLHQLVRALIMSLKEDRAQFADDAWLMQTACSALVLTQLFLLW